jgi:hypothetical protein
VAGGSPENVTMHAGSAKDFPAGRGGSVGSPTVTARIKEHFTIMQLLVPV